MKLQLTLLDARRVEIRYQVEGAQMVEVMADFAVRKVVAENYI